MLTFVTFLFSIITLSPSYAFAHEARAEVRSPRTIAFSALSVTPPTSVREVRAPKSAAIPSVPMPSAKPRPSETAPVSNPQPVPAPAAAPTPTPAPTQASASVPAPASFASEVEALAIQYMNAERSAHGLAALTADTKLATIARAHSADMLAKNYFSHTNQSGCDATCRLNGAGYSWSSYGENIHWQSGYEMNAATIAQKVVQDWMQSPGHRANILGSTFTHIGVGVSVQGTKVDTTALYSLPR